MMIMVNVGIFHLDDTRKQSKTDCQNAEHQKADYQITDSGGD
jgi:hypothetical protein